MFNHVDTPVYPHVYTHVYAHVYTHFYTWLHLCLHICLQRVVHQNVNNNFFYPICQHQNRIAKINNSKTSQINKQSSFCILSKLKTIDIGRISLNITSSSILLSSNRHHVQFTTFNAKNVVYKSTQILVF